MNRFKVKAKLTEGDRWVHGYYVFTNNKHYIITEQGGLSYPEQIRPDTICRCLDRFDIHGELIYENDHIRIGEVVGNHLNYGAEYIEHLEGANGVIHKIKMKNV